MTRISLLSGLDLPTPGSGYCDRETSAPGVLPGREMLKYLWKVVKLYEAGSIRVVRPNAI